MEMNIQFLLTTMTNYGIENGVCWSLEGAHPIIVLYKNKKSKYEKDNLFSGFDVVCHFV